jgi:hypothetical protein
MVERTYGVRQSDFEALTTITPGSYFGFFYNGYNYKITYANFISGLGVTGTIVQDGDVTGTPVLDVSGTVNNIRNLENGTGIACSVSAENGITVAHNFTVNATGSPLMLNTTALSPTFVSLVAGTGITLTAASSTITITNTPAVDQVRGQVYMQSNATATVIASTATPVLVAGTWTVDLSTNATCTTAGRITYTGTTTQILTINAALSLDPASGSNQNLQVYLYKNGSAIAGSRIESKINNGEHLAVPLVYQISMATNDYIEIYVQNSTATNNITVSRAVLSIN